MAQAQARRRRRARPGQAERPSVAPPGLSGGQYKPLSHRDVHRISDASFELLERVGIEVQPSECRDIFARAGARIDVSRNRVHIPRGMVEDALTTAQNEVLLAGRDPKHDMNLGGTRVYMGTGGAAVKILDLESGESRKTTLSDVGQIGKLVDALDNIHFYLRSCVAQDVPIQHLDLSTYYAAITNTSKHVTGNCFTVDSLRDVIEMGAMVAGGIDSLRARPIISFVTSWTVSPLRFAPETVEVLTEIVRQELPVFLSSAPQSGATSPAALAGSLVQINAEELSGLTYCQLIKPGTPVVLGYVPSVSDLRTGNFVGGAPEFALMHAAVAQLGQYYNLPVYNSSGLTDAKIPDAQSGYEKGISSVTAALSGANYIHHSAGMLESMLTVAYEQFVIDDDINGSIMRMVRGIEVTDETLSLDVIEHVCAGEGHFLGTQQSLDLMHSEYYYPHTGDRQSRESWEADGSLDMRARARGKARHILQTHQPMPIPPETDTAIKARFQILSEL